MAERLEGMQIGLDLDTVRIDRGLTGLKDRLKTVNSEMKSNMSAFDRADKSLGKYEERMKGLNKKLEVQKAVTEESRKSYEKMVAEYGEGSKQAEKAAQAYNKQAADLNDLDRYVQNATQELEEMRAEAKKNESAFGKMGKAFEKNGGRLTKVGGAMKSAGSSITKATAGIAGGVTAAAGGLYAFTDRVTQAADATAKGAEKVGVSTKAYQEMDYWASQNGISQQDMEKAVGRLNQRVGKAVDGNQKYADVLTQLGVNLDEVRAGNVSTEDAMAQSIQSLSEMTNEQDKAAAASELFGTKLGRELMPALNDGSLSIEDAKQKAKELGLVMSEDQLQAAEKFQDAQDDIKRSLGAVTQQIGLDLMPHFQSMLDWIKGNLPQIRETISGTFESVVENIKGVVKWFQNLNPFMQKAIPIFAAIAAAMGPILLVGGKLISVFGGIMTALGPVFTAIAAKGGLLATLKAGFIALSGPIGITVGVITALAAGFTLAYKKSETFRNIIHAVKDAFVAAYQKVKEFLTTNETILAFVENVKQTFRDVKQAVQNAIGIVVDFVQRKISEIKVFWDNEGSQILDAFRNIWTGIKMAVKSAIDFVSNIIDAVLPTIKSIFKTTFDTVLSIVKNVWNGIKGVIDGGLQIIKGLIKTFSGLFTGDFSKMWEGIKDIFSGAVKVVKSIVKTAFETIRDVLKGILKSISKVISDVWDGVKSYLKRTGESIWENIKNAWTTVKNGTADFFEDIYNNIKDKFDDIVQRAKDLPGRIGRGLKKMAKYAINGAIDLMNTLSGRFERGLNKIIGGLNSLLEKIGIGGGDLVPTVSIPEIPEYARGTGGHKGGPAVVGDGGMKELIRTPRGDTFLSPDRDTLVDLPKGTQVLSGPDTKKMMAGFPHYKTGVGDMLGSMWSGIKDGASWVKQQGANMFDWISEGGKTIVNKIIEGIGVKMPSSDDFFGGMIRGSFDAIKKALASFMGDKTEGFANQAGKGTMNAGLVKTSSYGNRFHPIDKVWKLHAGDDYGGPMGTPIPSQTGGRVSFAGWGGGYGNLVKVASGIYEHLYAHLSSIAVSPGQIIKRGGIVGGLGSTGNSTGPHLHYEVRKNGKPIPPIAGYAEGGNITKTQWAMVGEEGPELVKLPGGAKVLSNEDSQKQARKGILPHFKNGTRDTSMFQLDAYNPRLVQTMKGSNASRVREIRQSEIALLEKEIAYLTREGATIAELNVSKEKEARLSELQKEKQQQYVNAIEEQEIIIDKLQAAYDRGAISQENYNTRTSEATTALHSLKQEQLALFEAMKQTEGITTREREQQVRDDILSLLSTEIDYLTRAGASQKELNEAKEKQEQMDAYRNAKQREYQVQLGEAEDKILDIQKKYDQNLISEGVYNQQFADAVSAYRNLKEESIKFNQEIAQKQQEALEKVEKQAEEAAKNAADTFTEGTNDYMDAYETAMQTEMDAMQESHDRKLSLFEGETSRRKAELEKQKNAALQSFDEETAAREKAIQDQLDALNQAEEDDSRDKQREEWNNQRSAMDRRMQVAQLMGDTDTIRAVEEERAQLEKDIAEQQKEWRRADKKEKLKEQLSNLQEERSQERDVLQSQYDDRIEAYETRREQEKQQMVERFERMRQEKEREIELQKQKFTELQSQLAQHVEEGKLTQAQANAAWKKATKDFGNEQVALEMENQEKSKTALNQYVKDYISIGKSYGDGLMNGVIGSMRDKLSQVRSVASQIKSAASGALSGTVIGTAASSVSIPAMAAGGLVNSPTLSMVGEGRYPEAVLPLSEKVMGQLGQTIAKHMPEQTGSDTTIQLVMDGEKMAEVVMNRATGGLKHQARKGG